MSERHRHSHNQPQPQTYSVIAAIVRHYGRLELPASGDSMYPLIKERDICTFEALSPPDVREGDIVLYGDDDGRLVAHRFYRWTGGGGRLHAVCKGDANLGFDAPVPADRIIARLALIRKRGANLRISHPLFAWWGKVVVHGRYVSACIRLYLNRQAKPGRCRTS